MAGKSIHYAVAAGLDDLGEHEAGGQRDRHQRLDGRQLARKAGDMSFASRSTARDPGGDLEVVQSRAAEGRGGLADEGLGADRR